jgi:lysophospholipase L1-like esterase
VLLLGDSVALTLGLGLGLPAEQSAYDYTLTDKGILGCGVVDGPEVELMGTRDETPMACGGPGVAQGGPAANAPWPTQWQVEMGIDKPNVVVLLAGRWEVVDREYQGAWTNILSPAYAAYVKSQLEEASDVVTATGAHMVFLTAPCTDEGEQPDGSPWPEDNPARLAVYNKLVRQVVAEHPTTDSVVDLFGPTCPGGKFTSAIHGVVIRQTDGVHFTVAGGQYLAPKIMPAIVAAGRAQMTGTAGP